jgi:hypothetical protein
MDDMLLELCFEMLQDYVDGFLSKTLPREEVALAVIKFYDSDEDSDPTDDEVTVLMMEDTYELYDWWTVTRPLSMDAMTAVIAKMPNTPEGWPEDWMDLPKYQKTINYRAWKVWSDEFSNTLDRLEEEDDAQLTRLLQIRRWLWDNDYGLPQPEDSSDDVTSPQNISNQSETAIAE